MKCKVCGKPMALKKEDRYEIKRERTIAEVFSSYEPDILECFDCSFCGCQNVVNKRSGHKSPIPAQDELDQAFREGYEKGYERCKKDNEYEKKKLIKRNNWKNH